jgi:hypothetical protein
LQLASSLETFGAPSRTILSTKTATYNFTIVLKLQKQRLYQSDQQGHGDLQLADLLSLGNSFASTTSRASRQAIAQDRKPFPRLCVAVNASPLE